MNGKAGRTAAQSFADIVILGDGVIGLSIAHTLACAGANCVLVGQTRDGSASQAAAGLLAPSIGHLADDVRPFFFDSLDRFPAFLAPLAAFDATLALIEGLLDLSSDAVAREGATITQPVDSPPSCHLGKDALRAIEPALHSPSGARLYPRDAAIDNGRLVRALRAAVANSPSVTLLSDSATAIERSASYITVLLETLPPISAGSVVLAAGVWSPRVGGLPRPLPIFPLKGQMLAVASEALRHAVVGDDVYLVPRVGEVVIGATAERVGFDLTLHPDAIDRLRRAAASLCPSLAHAPVVRSWAGLRPATPDLLPVIGPDPDDPRLIYACGHSKNGILLAPSTADAVAALAMGRAPASNLAPFAISRFSTTPPSTIS